ncbi:MAG: DMT family transporter [Candidatus Methanomethylicus sp.]|nr:DMT family transporter [Candidatus Methanomethylicus sp.]
MRALNIGFVLVAAFLMAFDLVVSELAMRAYGADSLTMAAAPTIVGGVMLVAYAFRKDRCFLIDPRGSDWMELGGNVVFGALGALLTFDSVARIGAGKAMLLGSNTTEAIFIIVLSFLLLKERLSKMEGVGCLVILAGATIITFNPSSLAFELGLGELEILLASLSYAVSVVCAADLVRRVEPTKFVAVSGFLQGVILMIFLLLVGSIGGNSPEVLFIIILTGVLSGIAFLLYAMGLKGIGASLTSVVYSFVGIFSLMIGALFIWAMPGLELVFPPSPLLASIGSAIAIAGVYLLNKYKAK